MAAPVLDSLAIMPFEIGDLDAVLAIERDCFGTPWTSRQFTDEMEAVLSTFLVARRMTAREDLVGFVIWRQLFEEQQIFNIAVRSDLRRGGLGRWLLTESLRRGREAGATVATLEVHWANHPAVAFYRSFGFVEVGRRRDYYGQGGDALLLERGLIATAVE